MTSMNWFKRYGISGAYFTVLVIIWFYILTTGNLWPKENPTLLVGIAAIAFLPIGYIVSIFSLWLYYHKDRIFPEIHTESINGINKLKYLKDKKKSEADLEAELSVLYRLKYIENEDLERLKWFSQLITKRWDVLALNQAFIVSTILAPLTASIVTITIMLLTNVLKWPSLDEIWSSFWTLRSIVIILWFALSSIICLILRVSGRLVSKQMIKMYEGMLEYFPRDKYPSSYDYCQEDK